MLPISQMPVGELISSLRDIFFILTTLAVGWKARSWVQPAIDFIKKANNFFDTSEVHMRKVESGMQTLLSNHLSHIQSDLGHLSGREPRDSVFLQDTQDKSPDDVIEA